MTQFKPLGETEVIEEAKAGMRSIPIPIDAGAIKVNGLCEFDGRLYVACDHGLFVLVCGALVRVRFSEGGTANAAR